MTQSVKIGHSFFALEQWDRIFIRTPAGTEEVSCHLDHDEGRILLSRNLTVAEALDIGARLYRAIADE